MTPKEYWEGNPYLVRDYQKSHELLNEQKNQEMFIMANYIFEAFMTALSNLNFGKNPKPPTPYRKKPYDLRPNTKENRKKRADETRNKEAEKLLAWKKMWDSTHKEE